MISAFNKTRRVRCCTVCGSELKIPVRNDCCFKMPGDWIPEEVWTELREIAAVLHELPADAQKAHRIEIQALAEAWRKKRARPPIFRPQVTAIIVMV